MKTITQIAKEIGVSRQAVHNKIKQEPLSTSLQGFTVNTAKGLQIDVDGENLIKSAFSRDNQSTASSNMVDTITMKLIENLQSQINALTEQNQDLREQLNHERQHSREQADRILNLTEQAQALASNAQHLHAENIIKPQLIEANAQTKDKRKGFFSKWRFRGDNDG